MLLELRLQVYNQEMGEHLRFGPDKIFLVYFERDDIYHPFIFLSNFLLSNSLLHTIDIVVS